MVGVNEPNILGSFLCQIVIFISLQILILMSVPMTGLADSLLRSITLGSWGGKHIQMIVSAEGAKIEFDCAWGTIDEPLMVNKDGNFEAHGTYLPERGGPVRYGEPPPERHPAHFHGWTDGRQMRLTVRLLDTGESVGTFTLGLGHSPILDKCL
jgi:hypothetical protein